MEKILNLRTNKDLSVVFKNVLGSLFVKGLALTVSMYTMNAYFQYFRNGSYLGTWLAVSSILTWILTFDVGIGNGLRNHLTKALAKNDYNVARDLISSAYFSLGVISLIFVSVAIIISKMLNWNHFFGISTSVLSNSDLSVVMTVSIASICIRFFLNIITSVLYSLQKTFVINLVSLISNVSLLVYLFYCKPANDVRGIFWLSFAHMLTTNIPLLCATILIFSSSLRKSIPNIRNVKCSSIRKVVSLGGLFFIAQICLMLLNSTNQFIINKFYTPEDVVSYQIFFKVFAISIMVFNIIIQPIWSAITKASAEGKHEHISTYAKSMYIVALLGSGACFIVSLYFQKIVDVWLGDNAIIVSFQQSIIFVLYMSSYMFMNASTCIANGFGKLKPQVVFLPLAVVIKFLVVELLCKNYLITWEYMVLSTGVMFLIMAVIQGVSNIFTVRNFTKNI